MFLASALTLTHGAGATWKLLTIPMTCLRLLWHQGWALLCGRLGSTSDLMSCESALGHQEKEVHGWTLLPFFPGWMFLRSISQTRSCEMEWAGAQSGGQFYLAAWDWLSPLQATSLFHTPAPWVPFLNQPACELLSHALLLGEPRLRK